MDDQSDAKLDPAAVYDFKTDLMTIDVPLLCKHGHLHPVRLGFEPDDILSPEGIEKIRLAIATLATSAVANDFKLPTNGEIAAAITRSRAEENLKHAEAMGFGKPVAKEFLN